MLWNCEKDNQLENTTIENQITKKQLTIQKLSSGNIDTDLDLKSIASDFGIDNLIKTKVKSYLYERSNKSDSKFDFTINTDLIKKIKTDGLTSYTFLIERKKKNLDDKFFENLVIEKKGDSLKGYFIKYNIDKKFLQNNQKENLSGTAEITAYGGDINELIDNINKQKDNSLFAKMQNEECDTIEIFVETSCPCAGHWPGENCQCQTQPDTERYVFEVCSGGGDGDFNDGGTYYSDGGNSGGGGGGSYSATVVPDEELETLEKIFLSLLNTTERNFYLNNTVVKEKIRAYLAINDYSEISKNFAKEAIDALVNNGEIDLDKRLIYNPIIAQDYKARMSPAEIAIFDTLTTFQKEGYLRAATQTYIYSETHFPRPVRNTKGDTFKHTFWNALSTVYIGETLTAQLTTAHENINYDPNYPNHFKETQMDLFNNSKGRQIAYGSGRLYQLVQNALDNGELRYLSNLEFVSGFWRATNNSQLIPTNQ